MRVYSSLLMWLGDFFILNSICVILTLKDLFSFCRSFLFKVPGIPTLNKFLPIFIFFSIHYCYFYLSSIYSIFVFATIFVMFFFRYILIQTFFLFISLCSFLFCAFFLSLSSWYSLFILYFFPFLFS